MSRRVAVPGAVGVVALLAAGWFGYLTVRGGAAAQPRADVTPTHRVVSRQGGFSIGVPAGMHVTRRHGTLTLADRSRDLVVTVGRTGPGPLHRTTIRFVRSLRAEYAHVRVLGHQHRRVAGRRALATYGQAVNRHHARLRFVTVTVRERPRDYAITAFTAYGSDPATVLPRVDGIASTFSVRR